VDNRSSQRGTATGATSPLSDPHASNLWTQAVEALRGSMPRQAFDTWIRGLKLVAIEEETIRLLAPSRYVIEWVQENFLRQIADEIALIADKRYTIVFEVSPEVAAAEPGPAPFPPEEPTVDAEPSAPHADNPSGRYDARPAAQPRSASASPGQLVGSGVNAPVQPTTFPAPALNFNDRPLNNRYTFDNFVVGSSNQLAHAASRAVAEAPAARYNPLFIYGGVGLGKTHLVQAIGHSILMNNPKARIIYLSSESFMNELISALRFDKMDAFRAKYRDGCDVLLMDDIQFVAGKERTQEEFFHTFNTLYGARKQIVLTSDKFPKDIPNLEERLRSRFEWGLIADITAPEIETRIAILRKKAEEDKVHLPDDVAMFLATHIASNIRELEGGLIRVGAFSSLYGRPITLELAKEVLGALVQEKQKILTCEGIQKTVASFFNLKISDLKSPKKHKVLALPRQIAMYLVRKHVHSSFPDIGEKFGGKDHTTVLHACRKIDEKMKTDPTLKNTVESIEKTLEAGG
jgi:chromosomal replication initiator protein